MYIWTKFPLSIFRLSSSLVLIPRGFVSTTCTIVDMSERRRTRRRSAARAKDRHCCEYEICLYKQHAQRETSRETEKRKKKANQRTDAPLLALCFLSPTPYTCTHMGQCCSRSRDAQPCPDQNWPNRSSTQAKGLKTSRRGLDWARCGIKRTAWPHSSQRRVCSYFLRRLR